MNTQWNSRNRTFVLVATLLFLILVFFALSKLSTGFITGFAGQESGSIQEEVLFQPLDSTQQQIPQLPLMPELIDDEPQENIFLDSGRRGFIEGSSGSGFAGNSANSNRGNELDDSGNGVIPTGQSNKTQPNNENQGPTSFNKRLSKIPYGLQIKRNSLVVSEGQEFNGRVGFNLEKTSKKISRFNITFQSDIDISDIVADSDLTIGKSFMHHSSVLLEDIELFVPVKPDDVAIVICSNASSYDEIYYGCSELPEITKEEVLYLPNERVTLSDDGVYYIISGITGTGATGANVSVLGSDSTTGVSPGLDNGVFGGNLTEMNISGNYTTKSWQGYYGNASGVITLSDSSNNTLYNWTMTSPEGVIMASINDTIYWNNIQCFNYSASGSYIAELQGGGATNQYGTNLTQLEDEFNLEPQDIDGVDETFTLQGAGTHDVFYINNNEFSEGECMNTRIFGSGGSQNNGEFEEVILYEPSSYSVVFASLLNENLMGFNDKTHDFQLMVLEDGHNGDVTTTTYYFYTEMH